MKEEKPSVNNKRKVKSKVPFVHTFTISFKRDHFIEILYDFVPSSLMPWILQNIPENGEDGILWKKEIPISEELEKEFEIDVSLTGDDVKNFLKNKRLDLEEIGYIDNNYLDSYAISRGYSKYGGDQYNEGYNEGYDEGWQLGHKNAELEFSRDWLLGNTLEEEMKLEMFKKISKKYTLQEIFDRFREI